MKKDPTNNHQQLGNLFLRYKHLLKPPQSSVELAAIKTIERVTGITLTRSQLVYTVSTRTLIIKAPSLIRSELSLSHSQILAALVEDLGVGNAPLHLI